MADPKITLITEKKYNNPSNTTGSTSNTSKKQTVVNDFKDVGIFTRSTEPTNFDPETKTSGSPVSTDTYSIFTTGAAEDAGDRAKRTAKETAGIYDAYAEASSLRGVSTATSPAQSKVYLNNAQAMAGEAKSWMDQAANCYASDPTKAKALYEKAEKRLLEAQKMLKNAEAEGATLQDLAQTSQDVYHFLYQCRQNNVSGYDINASLDGTAEETGFWKDVAKSLPSMLPNFIQGLMGGSGKTDSSGNTTRTNQPPSSDSTSFSGASSKELEVPAGYENLDAVVAAKADYSKSQGVIDKANGAIVDAKGKLNAAEAQKKALGDEIKALDEEIAEDANKYMELKSKQAKHIQDQKKYEQIQTQKNELAKVYGQQIGAKNDELAHAKIDIESKKITLKVATEKVGTVNLEVTEAGRILAAAETKLQNAEGMYPEDSPQVADARNAVTAAKKVLREKEDALKKAEAAQVEAQKELEIAENKEKKIQQEINVLTERQKKALAEATEAANKAKDAKANADAMKKEIEIAGQAIEGTKIDEKKFLKTSIDNCFNAINDAQATIDENKAIIICERAKQDAAQFLANEAVQREQEAEDTRKGGIFNLAWPMLFNES